jgi:hypothetical protein
MRNKSQKQTTDASEAIRRKLSELISNFEVHLQKGELRPKVLALIPVFHGLRNLGKSLIPNQLASAGRARILYYLRKYPHLVINGDELLVVSGIQDYPRRLRELRVQQGWAIASGVTIKEMREEGSEEVPDSLKIMKPDDYVMLREAQDRDAAHRWHLANAIRKERLPVVKKILKFLLASVGQEVTNEELRYVSGNKTEWARRVRELRTEHGWPIGTKTTGLPDLDIGVYVLQADRQSPEHDRMIPDDVRRFVMRRDDYRCTNCSWSHAEWNSSDPRHLEIHHVMHHVKGGTNTEQNLTTLCTVCHDAVHRRLR